MRVRARVPARARAPELIAAAATATVTGWGLTGPSAWRDEGATRLAAGRDLADLWALSRTVDLVHLPYYLVAHPVLAVHDSVTALRVLSALAVTVTAAVLVATGRRLGSVRVGLVAGLLLAVAPLTSRYGQEARPYALAALAATVAAWRLAVVTSDAARPPDAPEAQGAGPRRDWLWYAVAVVATGLANVLALLVLAGHGMFVAVLRRSHLRPWLVTSGAALLLLGPFLVLTSTQSGQVGWLTRPGPEQLFAVLQAPFGGWVLPGALLVLAAATAVRARRAGQGRLHPATGTAATAAATADAALLLGVGWGLLPPVLLWLVSQAHPLFDGRYLVAALPGVALALASLAARARVPALLPVLVPGALVAALALGGLGAQRGYRDPVSGHGEDVAGAVRILTTGARPGDAVLFIPHHLRILTLMTGNPDAAPDDVALGRGPVGSVTLTGVDVAPGELPARLAGHDRVWLVTAARGRDGAATPTDAAKLEVLDREFTEVGHEAAFPFVVTLLVRRH